MPLALAVILVFSAIPRFWAGWLQSFWYDEVVSMKLAREPTPAAMLRRLRQIDATRAPLHPLILQGWIRVFGASEPSARSLSAACGCLTVLVVFAIGRRVGGADTGLWAAFFSGFSPLLLEYSIEARMYALLTLLTCLAWWNLLAFRDRSSPARLTLQSVLLAAMIYTHPLALLMTVALAAGWVVDRDQTRLTVKGWVTIHLGVALLVAPWIGRYFDHPPEFTSGRLPIRFLLGVPIGFTGGDSRTLVLFASIIALGLLHRPIRGLIRYPKSQSAWPIVAWLIVPPTLLYAYSWIGYPIFGPSRYNVFVAPAYLILIARGLASLGRLVAALIGAYLVQFVIVFGLVSLGPGAVTKADWRFAAEMLDKHWPGVPVFVISPTPGRNFEVEVARYYLGDRRKVIAVPDSEEDLLRLLSQEGGWITFAASVKGQAVQGHVPLDLDDGRSTVIVSDYQGLRLYKFRIRPRPL